MWGDCFALSNFWLPFWDHPPSHSGNVTVVSGHLARLNCRVRNLGNRTVSWIRLQDLSLLTVGRYTYTSDLRFNPSLYLPFSTFWPGLRGSTPSTAPTGSWRWRTLDWPTQVLCLVGQVFSVGLKLVQDLTSARCLPVLTWPTWSTSGSEVTPPKKPRDPQIRWPAWLEGLRCLLSLPAWSTSPASFPGLPNLQIRWAHLQVNFTSPSQVVWLHNGSEVTYNGPRTGVSLIIDKSEVRSHHWRVIDSAALLNSLLKNGISDVFSRWQLWAFCYREPHYEIREITLAGAKIPK